MFNQMDITKGFIDSLYFFASSESGIKNDDDFYDDGEFNSDLSLTDLSIKNINDLVLWFIKSLSANVKIELLDKMDNQTIGHNLFLDSYGFGSGFDDEKLSNDTLNYINNLLYNTFFFELFDDDSFVHLSYSYNITAGVI